MAGCFTSMVQSVMATTISSKVKREAQSTDDEVFYNMLNLPFIVFDRNCVTTVRKQIGLFSVVYFGYCFV